MNPYLYKPSIRKRVSSFLIDLFIMLTLFTIFFSYVFTPIFSATTKIDYYDQKITEMRINSHLYIKDKEFGYKQIIDEFDKNITLFYKEFDYEDIGEEEPKDYLSEYIDAKEESGLFVYSDYSGEWIEKEDCEKEKLTNFYNEQWENANNLLNKSLHLNGYSYRLILLRSIVVVVSIIFTYIFYNLLLPLILKNGQTIGKVACRLKIVDQFGFNVKYKRMVLRSFIGVFVDLIFALFFGITWFISVFMLIFSKNAITIKDYFALTYVVDAQSSTFFNSKEELEEFESKLKGNEFKYVHEKGY